MKMAAFVSFLVIFVCVNHSNSHACVPIRELLGGESTIRLDGEWVVVSISYCGKELEGTDEEKMAMRFFFSGKTFKTDFGGVDKATGTFQLDPRKSPKNLDLHYDEHQDLGPKKCIFELDGDKLKIAFNENCVPGTREEELRRAKEAGAKRPNGFDYPPGGDDPTMVITLKRQKK